MFDMINACVDCETCYGCGADTNRVILLCDSCHDRLEGKCYKIGAQHYCPECFCQMIEEQLLHITPEVELAVECLGAETVSVLQEVSDAADDPHSMGKVSGKWII